MRLDLEGTRRCKAICQTMEAKVNVLDLLAGSVTWICQHPGTVPRGSALRDKIKWVTGLVSEISAFPGHPYIRQLRTPIVLGVSHTSRIGTCSSNLLSHCTEMFDAERKKWGPRNKQQTGVSV